MNFKQNINSLKYVPKWFVLCALRASLTKLQNNNISKNPKFLI